MASSGERLRKVVLGSSGQCRVGGEGGLPQSHRAIGAEAIGAVCSPSKSSWLPTEEAVGAKLPLSINTFWNFPSGPGGKTASTAGVAGLIPGLELRSHMVCSGAQNK